MKIYDHFYILYMSDLLNFNIPFLNFPFPLFPVLFDS